jgi:hypothetical protein
MVKLHEAESQIIIDYEVYEWRPNDSGLSPLSTRIRHSWDAHHIWRRRMEVGRAGRIG